MEAYPRDCFQIYRNLPANDDPQWDLSEDEEEGIDISTEQPTEQVPQEFHSTSVEVKNLVTLMI